jgi:hypothetical protein
LTFKLAKPLKKATFDTVPRVAFILAVVASIPPNAGIV